MWLQADFRLDEQAAKRIFVGIRGRGARKWLASAATRMGIGLAPEVFGYCSDGRTPSSGRHIGIANIGNLFRITACGQDNIDLVKPHLPAIQAALIMDGQGFVRPEIREGRHRVEFTKSDLSYFAVGMYVTGAQAKICPVSKAWHDVSGPPRERHNDPAFHQAVAQVVDRTLSRQLRMLAVRDELMVGDSTSADDNAMSDSLGQRAPEYVESMRQFLSAQGVEREPRAALGVQVQSIDGAAWLSASSAGGINRLLLNNVEFTVKASLGGLWLAGLALSFGEGAVMSRVAPGRSPRASMLERGGCL